jgi:hypothetical protein
MNGIINVHNATANVCNLLCLGTAIMSTGSITLASSNGFWNAEPRWEADFSYFSVLESIIERVDKRAWMSQWWIK